MDGSPQWTSQMCHWLRPFLPGLYDFFENEKTFLKNWPKICDYELRGGGGWGPFCDARVCSRRGLPRETVEISAFIPTLAHGLRSKRTLSIDRESGVGVGGVLDINGNVCEFLSLDITVQIPHWLKGVKSLHRLIIPFGLLGTYVRVGLCAPDRLCNTDIPRLAIPIVTANLGNGCILRKHYADSRPASWMLQDVDARNLTKNI